MKSVDYSNAQVTAHYTSWVGNKNRYEGVVSPVTCTELDAMSEESLIGTILKPYVKEEELYSFNPVEGTTDEVGEAVWAETDTTILSTQELIARILNAPKDSAWEVKCLGEKLYNLSTSPKLQGGEFFVSVLEGVLLHGAETKCVALWKVEDKDIYYNATGIDVKTQTGISSGKPKLSALIFDVVQESGKADDYVIMLTDRVTNKNEQSHWKSFLDVSPMMDEYFQTRHHAAFISEFIKETAPIKFGLNRLEAIGLLTEASAYLQNYDEFGAEDFAQAIFQDPERIEYFNEKKAEYSSAYGVPMYDFFDINKTALKRSMKFFKSNIKLDDNFLITVKSRPDLVKVGYDEVSSKKFYQIFFEEQD